MKFNSLFVFFSCFCVSPSHLSLLPQDGKDSICNLNFPLPHNIMYSQVLGIRMWTSLLLVVVWSLSYVWLFLGGHYSAYHICPLSEWGATLLFLVCWIFFITTHIECLLSANHSANCLIQVMSFNPHLQHDYHPQFTEE